MSRASEGLVHSVKQRLLNHAKEPRQEFEQVLVRYGCERLLYRLSISDYKDQFVLKGALLFLAWEGTPHRMTRDIDLLGYGDDSVERVATVMRALCNVSVPDDGLNFDPTSVRGEPIRGLDEYGGVRIALAASLGSAAIRLQVDVGFGDAVTPGPQALEFPVLLDFPRPQLRAYPPETVIAEKLLTLCERGLANSRMKDYFDLLHLAQTRSFDSALLIRALSATAERRRVMLPLVEPTGLTLEFGRDAAKRAQWAAFLHRTRVVPCRKAPRRVSIVRLRQPARWRRRGALR